jgi:two-component system, OmpR family, alkaline phosphatase synthesis response regulator PhoP
MAKKILVTEDSPTILEILKSVLSEEGYEVIAAADGQQALDLARTEKPDLIILDLMLPKIDGYKVCRMLKFDEKYKEIPIIMLTARTKDEDEQLGKEVGADAYIKKPFQPEMIVDKIKEFLNP